MKRFPILLFLAAFLLAAPAGAAGEENKSAVKNALDWYMGAQNKVVSWYMDNMNYGTVALLMTVESSCFIPFPSEVVVPPAAYKASQEDGGLNIVLVVLFASVGAMLGAVINYYFALFLGRPVIYRFAESRLGRICLLSREKIEKAEAYFVKHGNISTLICRLIPGVRQVISVPAGLAKMPFWNFFLYTFIGATIWNIILAVLGYAAHGNADLIKKYSKEISIAILAMGVLFCAWLAYAWFFKKRAKA